MVIKQGKFYQDKIIIKLRADGDFETSFRIAIKNDGNATLKADGGYWHLYFPIASKIVPDGKAKKFITSDLEHIRNPIDLPIFHKSFLSIGPEFKVLIKKEQVNNFKVYYFF